ncbi:hypothetical protein FRX31_006102, partial [Thalictrum thalictroides]
MCLTAPDPLMATINLMEASKPLPQVMEENKSTLKENAINELKAMRHAFLREFHRRPIAATATTTCAIVVGYCSAK